MFATHLLLRAGAKAAMIGGTIVVLSACVATYRNHGYVPAEDELAEIALGVDTRNTVIETIGPPSSTGILNQSGLYYIQERKRFYGPMAPKTIERELLAISFDDQDVVQDIERFDIEDGKVISLERRMTDTGASRSTFLRQLLGNLGNFSAEDFLNN